MSILNINHEVTVMSFFFFLILKIYEEKRKEKGKGRRDGGREGDKERPRSEMTAGKLHSRASQLLSGQIYLGSSHSFLDHPKGKSQKAAPCPRASGQEPKD